MWQNGQNAFHDVTILTPPMWCISLSSLNMANGFIVTRRVHDVMITSLLRKNDVAMSFWRNNGVIITSCVRWEAFIETE